MEKLTFMTDHCRPDLFQSIRFCDATTIFAETLCDGLRNELELHDDGWKQVLLMDK